MTHGAPTCRNAGHYLQSASPKNSAFCQHVDQLSPGTELAHKLDMSPTQLRLAPRHRQRGVTTLELGVIAAALAVVATGATLFLGSRESSALENDSSVTAERIRSAALDFRREHGTGCPTLTQLKRAELLDDSVPLHDAWGERFRVHCVGDDVSVTSAGPDGKPDSTDDVRAPSNS